MEPRTLLEALSVAEKLKDTTRHFFGIFERVERRNPEGYIRETW